MAKKPFVTCPMCDSRGHLGIIVPTMDDILDDIKIHQYIIKTIIKGSPKIKSEKEEKCTRSP